MKKNINTKEIIKKEGKVVICQPNHSITTVPVLLESHDANELIEAISSIRKRIFNN